MKGFGHSQIFAWHIGQWLGNTVCKEPDDDKFGQNM
jgi:hypothetical protein